MCVCVHTGIVSLCVSVCVYVCINVLMHRLIISCRSID